MIFSIVILLLVAVIAYFYFVQGFLTATLSAVAAALGAVLSLSYYEPLTVALFQSKFVDLGNAISLLLIYAASFIVLRLLFDKLVPGNVRLQSTVDKAGGAVMGVIIGIFTMGIMAIATQSMPFGPSIMGQARYKTGPDREVTVPGQGVQAADEQVTDEMIGEKFDLPDRQTLLLPVDDWVVGFVSMLSDGGSLAGNQPLTSVHPALLDEFFGQRIGIQPGAVHVLINTRSPAPLTIPLAYVLPQVNEGDAEIKQLRAGALRILKPSLQSDAQNEIVVIRLMFTRGAADTDGIVRFAPGSIRLLANGTNYFPIGSLDTAGVLRINKPDDAIAVGVTDTDHGADMVFFLPKSGVLHQATDKDGNTSEKFVDGSFLEVKRETRIDLSGVTFVAPQAPDKTLNVLRKKLMPPALTDTPAAPAASLSQPANAQIGSVPSASNAKVPFVFDRVELSNKLFAVIAPGLLNGPESDATFPTGSAFVRQKQLDRLQVRPDAPIRQQGTGDNATAALFVPAGKHMVQLIGTPPPQTDDAWAWSSHLHDFALIAASGEPVKASGAAAKVLKSQQFSMAAAYQSDGIVPLIASEAGARPTDVWLLFNVTDGLPVKELDYQGRMVVPLNMPG